MKEIIDHRTIRSGISPGGTSRAFALESGGGSHFVALVESDRLGAVQIEALYAPEQLFQAAFAGGVVVGYDYGGNLQKLNLDLVSVYRSLSEAVIAGLNAGTLAAVESLIEHDSELLLEIDLKDGLALGDKSGWVQLSADKNLKRTDDGIGGGEIWPEAEPTVRQILVNDPDGAPIGFVYLAVGLIGDQLVVGVGDLDNLCLAVYRRLVDPEKLALARTPAGARTFVDSLMD